MPILTAAEARLHIPELQGNDTVDADIDTIIARADALIATWLGFPPATAAGSPTLLTATYTVYLDGPSPEHDRLIWLPVKPVQSVTTIHDDVEWSYGASTLVAAGDYTEILADGEVILNPTGSHSWSRARRAIKVVFEGGWASVPPDVKQAAILFVRHLYDLKHRQGLASSTKQGATQAHRDEQLPAVVRQMLSVRRLCEAFSG